MSTGSIIKQSIGYSFLGDINSFFQFHLNLATLVIRLK